MTKIFSILGLSLFLSLFAYADTPGVHPAFLHALTDLRTARWHLEHRGGSEALQNADREVVEEIDRCIDEIKKAAIDDGKNLDDHPHEDDGKDKTAHVHRARQLLEKARKDISEKETNVFSDGLRDRALHHLDEALVRVNRALTIKK